MSPYRVKGSAVYVKRGDRWVKKQQTGSPEKAQAAMRLMMEKEGMTQNGRMMR